MLPFNRWPAFLWRVAWALVAPQRAALDSNRRLERQWSINRGLNLEVQRLSNELRDSKRVAADYRAGAEAEASAGDEARIELRSTSIALEELRISASTNEAERRTLADQLSSEQSRHKETALNLDRETAKGAVLGDQMAVLVQWRETELKRLEAEARIEELRGRSKVEE